MKLCDDIWMHMMVYGCICAHMDHSTKWRVSVDGNIPVSERKLVFPSRQTRVSVN